MSIQRPTDEQLQGVAKSLGIELSAEQIASYNAMLQPNFDAYDVIDALPDNVPEVVYPQERSHRPPAEPNEFGAWSVKTNIRGKLGGRLAGKTVVLKDNVSLAGVPMRNGSSTFEGYVSDVDATLVTRLLDAGATVVGKAVCEHFCFSGGSHTSSSGPVHNPHRMGYSAGGSSSGSAALVAAGEVDMAIGGDQGGSIRIPAAYCGIYGMKATHGLVPYTGVMPIELTLDHTGPMTSTVTDNALMLEVIAGPDMLDPRQHAGRGPKPYSTLMKTGVKGMRIGIVAEGFGWAQSDPAVDAKVRAAARLFEDLGATVEDVSVPMHKIGQSIWLPIAAEGGTQQMMKGNSHGYNWKGLYVTSMVDFHAGWRSRTAELSDELKITMLLGEYFTQQHGGHYYAKAQNLARKLTAAYDEAFDSYDLLLMPTVPTTATPLPQADATFAERLACAFDMLPNTAPFNATGHPSMTIPCGLVKDLPVGMMLTGRMYDEETIYRAAYAFEQAADWKTL
jgi:amidase